MFNTAMLDPNCLGRRRRVLASPTDELMHFEVCPMCSQAIDRRDIHAVRHHLAVGHDPQPRH